MAPLCGVGKLGIGSVLRTIQSVQDWGGLYGGRDTTQGNERRMSFTLSSSIDSSTSRSGGMQSDPLCSNDPTTGLTGMLRFLALCVVIASSCNKS